MINTKDELLNYGTILEDIDMFDLVGNAVRYRLVELDSVLYSLYMENGSVIELKKVGRI